MGSEICRSATICPPSAHGVVRSLFRWIPAIAVIASASVAHAPKNGADAAALADRVSEICTRSQEARPTFVRPSGSLFALDLSDRAAVEQRLETIDARIASLTQTLPPIATSSTSTTAVPPRDRAPDARVPRTRARGGAAAKRSGRRSPSSCAPRTHGYDAYLASEALAP